MKLVFALTISVSILWAIESVSTESACQSTLSVITQALSQHETPMGPCSECQGRAGKRGPVGPIGPIGPKGQRGFPGSCKCDFSFLEALQEKIRLLEAFQKKASGFPGLCYAGIHDGTIPLSSITASSTHSSCPISHLVLQSAGAWCAARNDANQWLQVDLRTPTTIVGILTQGRRNADQWVRSYKVSYGNIKKAMTFYSENGSVKIFEANSERQSIVKNVFSNPLTSRYYRIHPVTHHGHMSMRIELLEC